VSLYSHDAPRVGGRALSAFISGQAKGNYRVTHRNDPVPKLPLRVVGFVHVSGVFRRCGEWDGGCAGVWRG
jgi:hypothetical protein